MAGCYISNSNAFNHTLPSAMPVLSSGMQSQEMVGSSQVIKKTVHLPSEQSSDILELLEKLKSLRVEDEDEAYAPTYFQVLSKQPSYINMLQMPTAYALVPSNRQHAPWVPPSQPNQMIYTCPF